MDRLVVHDRSEPTNPSPGGGVVGERRSCTGGATRLPKSVFRGRSFRRCTITEPKVWSWPISSDVRVTRGERVYFLRHLPYKGWFVLRVESLALVGHVVWEPQR